MIFLKKKLQPFYDDQATTFIYVHMTDKISAKRWLDVIERRE